MHVNENANANNRRMIIGIISCRVGGGQLPGERAALWKHAIRRKNVIAGVPQQP
jgi:hypothetical protein